MQQENHAIGQEKRKADKKAKDEKDASDKEMRDNAQQAMRKAQRDAQKLADRVKQLSGLLPICGYCKKIRDDKNYWQQVEAYVGRHPEAKFSHSICPDCYESIVKPEMIRLGVKP